ncbi:MAG: hypothetical protein Q4D21_08360 [Phascolarctobacterium sp.]|nr:hypothetical protein [Phascolarctobacterium sp.]
MINFTIDELIPCLKDTTTGEIYETEIVRIRRKSFLSKFNKRTGWYVSGQMKLSEKDNIQIFEDDESIYNKEANLHYDLRKYAEYIKSHNLKAKDITPEIMNMFWIP